MAYFFSLSDKKRLAKSIGFNVPLGCSCHSVAPRPFVLALVVITFG